MSMGNEAMIIRQATAEDLDVLRAVGLEAMNWTGESRFTFEQFMSLPELSHYLEGWPRPGDWLTGNQPQRRRREPGAVAL
jgi:hypothetical protein